MLGRDHALLGVVAGLALAQPFARIAHVHLPPGQVAAAATITVGCALLPDIDEPGSTVSRKLGPISEAAALVTNKLAGGHRRATHSIWFAGAVAVITWWLGRFALTAPILVYASLALTLSMLVPGSLVRKGSVAVLLAALAAGWATWRAETGSWLTSPTRVAEPRHWVWLPVAAGAGVTLHLVGDMLTAEGVPLLWPLRLRPALPLLGQTASVRERILGAGLSLALPVACWFEIIRPLVERGHH